MANSSGPQARLVESSEFSQTWTAGRGALGMRWTTHGAIVITVAVHGERTLAPLATRRTSGILSAHGSLTLFYDFWNMPNYDSEMRSEWTAWAVEHRSQLKGIHILLKSKFVAMGVSVANLALGGAIKSYQEKRPFVEALHKVDLQPIELSGFLEGAAP